MTSTHRRPRAVRGCGVSGIKWGENLERDCLELRRLESWGLYAPGHHKASCPLDHVTPVQPETGDTDA